MEAERRRYVGIDRTYGWINPAFISGGVADDVQRNTGGETGGAFTSAIGSSMKGSLKTVAAVANGTSGNAMPTYSIVYDPSLVVKIGPENSPRTTAIRYWRRVA
jgi:hypothetical protein